MSAKKLKIEYGDSVFALPKDSLTEAVSFAGAVELKILILAAADDTLRADLENAKSSICQRLDITGSAFDKAIKFWASKGVLSIHDITGEASVSADACAASSAPKKTLQTNSLPAYTEEQAADIIESHTEIAGIIDACQQIAEKMFTPNEVQSIIGMYDYLGLTDAGYIETLYLYCKSLGKVSPRYVEKVAIGLHDSGITTTTELNEHIKLREMCDDMMSRIRLLIGAGDRALTAKEKRQFEVWCTDWKLDMEVITKAYEVTVDNIGEYKLPYMSKVLENWHGEGLDTVDAVEKSLEAYKKNKSDTIGSDFNEDEYFEAALARSARYLEKNSSEEKGGD